MPCALLVVLTEKDGRGKRETILAQGAGEMRQALLLGRSFQLL